MFKQRSNGKFVAIPLIALLLFSCGDDAESETTTKRSNQKVKTEDRISKIEISQFGKSTNLIMQYSNDAVNIEFQPYQDNVEARIEFNEDKQIREVISGPSRIQYIYNNSGQEIGIFSNNGQQQIMFEYDGENLTNQYTINGNDTVVKFRYQYVDGVPSVVEIVGAYPYYRKYELEYSDIDNALTGFNELVLPSELVSLLGIPAIYSKKYLKKAVRVDAQSNEQEPLQESYTPSMQEVIFEISKTGKQETLKLTTDGSRQWSAIIYW
ncbi:MAG: hypothetical protein Crog4KO_29780 [Crocinitomicaceae bacterium]